MAPFVLRAITPDDAACVAGHRAAMFREMGTLAERDVGALVAATRVYLREAIATGAYVGWVATPGPTVGMDAAIAGGAGIQLRPLMPRPNPAGGPILTGRQGIVLNVFVEPAFRRQGLARLLVETAIDWARRERLASLVLHASEAGRPLYEKLGFAATSEMRFTGNLVDDGAG